MELELELELRLVSNNREINESVGYGVKHAVRVKKLLNKASRHLEACSVQTCVAS